VELKGCYGKALLDELLDYYNMTLFPLSSTSSLQPNNTSVGSTITNLGSANVGSANVGSGMTNVGSTVGRLLATSGAAGVPGRAWTKMGVPQMGMADHQEDTTRTWMSSPYTGATTTAAPVINSFPPSAPNAVTSSSLSLVNSILNDQQSRGSVADRLRLPSPPLIQPRFSALLRSYDQSPLTVISSSSPELMLDDSLDDTTFSAGGDRYPGMRLMGHQDVVIKREEDRLSPELPVACPLPFKNVASLIRNMDFKPILINKMMGEDNKMVDTEDSKEFSSVASAKSSSESNKVSVVLTLSSNAGENIGGVIAAIADLLRIAVPPSYEISRSPSPDSAQCIGYAAKVKHKEEAINIQSLMMTRSKYCCNCDAVILSPSDIIKKKNKLSSLIDDQFDWDDSDDLIFCSPTCCDQFDSSSTTFHHKATPLSTLSLDNIPPSHPTASLDLIPPHPTSSDDPSHPTQEHHSKSKQHRETNLNFSSLMPIVVGQQDVKNAEQELEVEGKNVLAVTQSSPQTDAGAVQQSMSLKGCKRSGEASSRLKHKTDSDHCKAMSKKMKEMCVRHWSSVMVRTETLIKAATEQQLSEMMDRMSAVIRPKVRTADTRKCVLCQVSGDADTTGPGRLLLLDTDEWVHLNCALWSYEVYETMNGALVNVDVAVKRGVTLDCVMCQRPGATISCFKKPRCTNVYHVACAQKDGAVFYEDKTVLCSLHCPPSKQQQDDKTVLSCLSVFRRVYINRDENKQIAKFLVHHEDKKCVLRIGGLVIHSIGQLLAHQIHSGHFNTTESIYPIGFKSTRYYWSQKLLNKRCRYICKIEEMNERPEFVVTVLERGQQQVVLRDSSTKGVWHQILESLEKMRRANDCVKVFPTYLSADDLFGLTEPTVLKIIESMPGIEMLPNYHFRYGRCSLYKLPLAINPSGCARTEPKLRIHFRKPYALQSGSNSRTLPSTVTVMPGDVNSPYLKQFVHSKSQQYRRLKSEWRNNVYLRRSNVQGLGLFAARELEKHTMVIEYIGQLIRNEVAEKREKLYANTNHGVYMFRIDDNCVVDATMSGGPARYVNHSCNPNCVAEVVAFEKESKIIIITKRKIAQGEELSYDYKFDFEDDQHKIPCLCGAANCRKWMN